MVGDCWCSLINYSKVFDNFRVTTALKKDTSIDPISSKLTISVRTLDVCHMIYTGSCDFQLVCGRSPGPNCSNGGWSHPADKYYQSLLMGYSMDSAIYPLNNSGCHV